MEQTAAGTRPWKTRLGFGNQLIALYQGTTLVVPPPGQKVRASAPATVKYARISNGKALGLKCLRENSSPSPVGTAERSPGRSPGLGMCPGAVPKGRL